MRTFPILEKLGGLDATFDHLRERGFSLQTRDALRMWRSPKRGVIPGDAAVILMQICEDKGIAYSADDFKIVEVDAEADAEAAE